MNATPRFGAPSIRRVRTDASPCAPVIAPCSTSAGTLKAAHYRCGAPRNARNPLRIAVCSSPSLRLRADDLAGTARRFALRERVDRVHAFDHLSPDRVLLIEEG